MTENHTHGRNRSTWLHLMTPNVPGAQLSHQMPPANSCWGTGFGTLHNWGGERSIQGQAHMLVLSAFLKSEYLYQEDTLALLRSMSAFGGYKGRSKLLFLNPVLHLHTHSLHSVLLVNEHPWICHSPSTSFPTTQRSLQASQKDWQGCKASWLAIFKMLCPFSPEDKAAARYRIHDVQSALTMNIAYWLQSQQHVSGWGCAAHITSAMQVLLISPVLFHA